MFRVFIPFLNLLAALLITRFFPADVSIKMEVPTQVVAGTEFNVKITVNKGDLESFSRFQQVIPAGLSASSDVSSNADFSFKDHRVRLIWLRLPRQEEFTFNYKVKVDERLKGTFTLKGKFSYIQNNERKSISVPEQSIEIQPSPNIDPSQVVDIKDFEEKVIQYIPPYASGSDNIICVRQKPYLNDAGNEYMVNILVNKENKEKFAKIEENIPVGYKAVQIDTKDAIFTFKDHLAKFLWMNLPSEPYYVVSYKLIPVDPKNMPQPLIKGQFSYLEGEKTISIDIVEKDIAVKDLSKEQVQQFIPAVKSSTVIPEEVKPPEKEPVKQQKKKVTPVEEPITGELNKKEMKSLMPYMLEPEQGVYYRVQLAAGHKPVIIRRYFKKYDFKKEIRTEYHEGWIKYSIGSYKVYKDARDARVQVWNTTDIKDAFVSAYNNGTRITVQEALMIANQKWYK
jgi:hypothetical protein